MRLLLGILFMLAAGCLAYAQGTFSGDAGILLQFSPAAPSMADSQLEVSVVADLSAVTAPGDATPVLTGFSMPVGFDPSYVRLVSAVAGTATGYSSDAFAFTEPSVANARGFVTMINLRAENLDPGLHVELAKLTFELKRPGNLEFVVGTVRTIYKGTLAAVPSDTGTPTDRIAWDDQVYPLRIEPGETIPSLLCPSWISQSGMFQGMVFMNDGTTDASLQMFGWGSDGSLFETDASENPSPFISLASLNQYARLADEVFNTPEPMNIENGWIEARPDSPDLNGIFVQAYTAEGLILQLDGAQISSTPMSRILFPLIGSNPNRAPEIVLSNPGDAPVDMTLRLADPAGWGVQLIEAAIPAHGTYTYKVSDTNVFADIQASNGQLVAVERFGTPDALAMLNGQDGTLAANRLTAPQFASGFLTGALRITTHLALVNPSTEATTVTFRLMNDSGEEIVNPVVRILQGGTMLSSSGWELFGLDDPLEATQVIIGSVAIESDGGLVGAIMFGDPVAGKFLAALPLMSTASAKRQIVFGHTAVGHLGMIDYFTGIALVNASQTDTANIHLEYHNSSGELVAQTTTPVTLGPNCRMDQLVQELIPDFPVPQSGGFIRLTSDVEVYAYMLFGDNFYNFTSAVP